MTTSDARPARAVEGREGGRTVLITGTSSGIGLSTAVAAAATGWTVIASMRDISKAAALEAACADAGVSVEVSALDVTDADSIARCVRGVVDRHHRLDALVNNAGAAHVGTIKNDELQAIRANLEVNFFGVVALVKAALPLLREAKGRIITVSSIGGVVGQPFNEAYCAAKFAVEGFMESLAPVAKSVGVSVSLVEPGAVASEFVANAGLDAKAMLASAGPYAEALGSYLRRVTGQFASKAQGAREVAELIATMLNAAAVPLRVQTSEAAREFVARKLQDLDGSAVQDLTTSWVREY